MYTCAKCGEPLPGRPVTAIDRYCRACQVRLGLLAPTKAGVIVRPDAADYYQKQLDEKIIDTWIFSKARFENERHTAPLPQLRNALDRLLGDYDDADDAKPTGRFRDSRFRSVHI